MTREQQIEKASIGRYSEWGEQQHALELAFQAGAMWADANPKPVDISMKDIEELAKEVVTKDWQEQQERLLDMIERNYRAHFMRSACKWLEQNLHHDNVGGFWADATSVEDFINQFKSSCSEIPNNLKGGEQ